MLMQTDQTRCYDGQGRITDCHDGLQDGACRAGMPWPGPRFRPAGPGRIKDGLTGLTWTRNANPATFPLTWQEAFDYVDALNGKRHLGFADWRLPNRRELFSLISHNRINPSLPDGHLFEAVFPSYYWTASSCCRLPNQAWYIHLGGGRVFKGIKANAYLTWPVRGEGLFLMRTGQSCCYDTSGKDIDCRDVRQDGDIKAGIDWKEIRMEIQQPFTVTDTLSGLMWHRNANLVGGMVDWPTALARVAAMNRCREAGYTDWRLPNIIELESLCHLDRHSPCIVAGERFSDIQLGYWSGTTSVYDPSYAWVLYTEDGNIGVGHKPRPEFGVWAVRSV